MLIALQLAVDFVSNRALTQSSWFSWTATCNAVSPRQSTSFTSAPYRRSSLTISGLLCALATCKHVSFRSFCRRSKLYEWNLWINSHNFSIRRLSLLLIAEWIKLNEETIIYYNSKAYLQLIPHLSLLKWAALKRLSRNSRPFFIFLSSLPHFSTSGHTFLSIRTTNRSSELWNWGFMSTAATASFASLSNSKLSKFWLTISAISAKFQFSI